MFNWIKNIFKPYQGSSKSFVMLYQYAKDELSLKHFDPSTVNKILGCLSDSMKTYGDARLIAELQCEFSIKLRSLEKESHD